MDNSHILLVEDNAKIQKANRRMLELNGYIVDTVPSLAGARASMEKSVPDLLVLDIMLPDGSGLAFCEEVRTQYDMPILFLTALGEKDSIVKGLRAGGDDYLPKPYDYDELLARIEALLRRAERRGGRASPGEDIGPLHLDHLAGRAYLNGRDVLLKPKEYALLHMLVQSAGQYLRAEDLYAAVWGSDVNGDARTVYVHISGLRKKLCMQKDGVLNIEHTRGKGYRFVVSEKKEVREL
ncbi:response regulator transcription factor [Ruminococcaceae bacterium OttesenSCG-928-I18]|nr:response regulator transcription factor [Ruminococcaceae bacterium OttesenSCG-928-I18]